MSIDTQTAPAHGASMSATVDEFHDVHAVHDEQCTLHPGRIHRLTVTGAALLTLFGRPATADQTVLQVLRAGGVEDIRLDERVNLELGDTFVFAQADCLFVFTLNDKQYKWPHRQISGVLLIKLAGVDREHQVVLFRDGAQVVVAPSDLVDLSQPGIEHFRTIAKTRRWELTVQGVPVFSDKPEIKVRDAMTEAGFDVNKGWQIFLIVQGKPKQPLTLDSVVDLREPGIEKIRLMTANVGNGDGVQNTLRREFKLLPADVKYLNGLGNPWEAVLVGDRRWLLIHDYAIPQGFAPRVATLALDVPKDYPAAQIDMFYFAPFVTFASGGEVPSTQVRADIHGVTFQGWSRHRNGAPHWDPNTDNIVTHMALVEFCIARELGE